MGQAFCHGVKALQGLRSGEWIAPYVVYWHEDQPLPVSYRAATQAEAVEKAIAERKQKSAAGASWAAGREGVIDLPGGGQFDTLVIEGWIPGLDPIAEMFVYRRKQPFRLIRGFLWKSHPYAGRDTPAFMEEFKRGILSDPFGRQCLDAVAHAENLPFSRGAGA